VIVYVAMVHARNFIFDVSSQTRYAAAADFSLWNLDLHLSIPR